ncbi:MAG: glycyl-tRNA synthetase, partial [Candidatus Methanomethylophilaceae archaeon]|nr:glycyl-tRNA synthetase [Candidatus Methanomethylophilaceae archaeon]
VELFVDPENKTWPRYPFVKEEMLRLIPNDGVERVMSLDGAVREGVIANEVLAYFIWLTKDLLVKMGVDPARLHFRQHLSEEMAHYATDCWDAEVLISYGWTEIVGIADRGSWDLTQHAKWSHEDMTHFKRYDEPHEVEQKVIKAKHSKLGPRFKEDAKEITNLIESCQAEDIKDGALQIEHNGKPLTISDEFFEVETLIRKVSGEKVIPHVIEPSYGLDRIFYTILEHAYHKRDDDYTVLKLKPILAPIKVGVFPLMARDGLDEKAQEIFRLLMDAGIEAYYDDSGSIGKRYARMDEIGTPWCVTIDYETLEEGRGKKDTVTIRDRDSTKQIRVPIDKLVKTIHTMLNGVNFESI